jgi:hypothetical protein
VDRDIAKTAVCATAETKGEVGVEARDVHDRIAERGARRLYSVSETERVHPEQRLQASQWSIVAVKVRLPSLVQFWSLA